MPAKISQISFVGLDKEYEQVGMNDIMVECV